MSGENLTIDFSLDGQNCRFLLGPLACLELARFVEAPPPVYLLDGAVAKLHAPWVEQIQEGCDHLQHPTLVLPGGEQVKTMEQLEKVYAWLAENGVSRDRTLVAVGGGAVLDLAGMAAATWRRGVPFVSFPTTLLAMVDAAIGGKTAINTAGLKNPVGVFHPAKAILADQGFLATLTRQCWRDGLAELIKTAAIGAPHIFQELHEQRARLHALFGEGDPDTMVPGVLGSLPWPRWIAQAARVKAEIVQRDFREQGERRNLNLGHTLGHVLEAWTMGTDRPLSHGEAVAVGMSVVFRLAAERGTCPLPAAVKMTELLDACGLPTTWAAPPRDDLEKLLGGDKKQHAGGLRWVLPLDIGRMNNNGSVQTEELLRWLD
jgi:3-dehydroquinate synthase